MDIETMKTLFTYLDRLNFNLQRIAIALEKQGERTVAIGITLDKQTQNFDHFGHEFGRQHETFKDVNATIVDIKKVLDNALTGGLITHKSEKL